MIAKKDKMEVLRKRNLQYLDEARLATFWYIDGELQGWDTAINEGEDCGDGYVNAPDAHCDIWDIVRDEINIPMKLPYDYYPRGRIVYNKFARVFTVYADPVLMKNEEFKTKIINTYRLPENRVQWDSLPDYHHADSDCELLKDEEGDYYLYNPKTQEKLFGIKGEKDDEETK